MANNDFYTHLAMEFTDSPNSRSSGEADNFCAAKEKKLMVAIASVPAAGARHIYL